MEIKNIRELNIVHVDMDAFYASVEERDNPGLKGTPVIVGGNSNHGIVTTANYEARKYGIHSAMPIFMAKKLCPHGNYIHPRMHHYHNVSREVFDILHNYSQLIEQVSVDEAYLDISHIKGQVLDIAETLKEEVYVNTGLTMSVGISYNKFLAKLASDWNKPGGIKVIEKEMIPNILFPLKVRKVHGIGAKSAKKLNDIGIYTVEDLYNLPEDFMLALFGKSGTEIYQRIRGIDNRKIHTNIERKSLGIERTFEESTKNKEELISYIESFSQELSHDLKKSKIKGKTIILKVKDENFITQTRSKTLIEYTNDYAEILTIALGLFNELNIRFKIRLVGLTASNLINDDLEQLSLFK